MLIEDKLKIYSDLILKNGLKLKKDDKLLIRASVENYDFTRILTKTAFELGAADVKIAYFDEVINRYKLIFSSKDVLSNVPKHLVDENDYYLDSRFKILSLTGGDPNSLKDVNPDNIKTSIIAKSTALKEYNMRMMKSEVSWCVAGAATIKWAKAVFPNLSESDALEKLWDKIFYTVRLDYDNPISNWNKHVEKLNYYSKFLNDKNIEYLHFSNDLGTDLKVGLPNNYIFCAASENNSYSEEFIANIPTEEVFSMPHRKKVNGIVYSTKPLNYSGNIISNFYLKFQNGKVIDFDAEEGYETLKNLLNSDVGSKYLGEVAIVPHNSPISKTNILFFNTLYDENASCHLALGKAYPTCIKNGDKMTNEELLNSGVNDSIIHVDFMIGNETTNICAHTKDGEEIQIFKNGNFII